MSKTRMKELQESFLKGNIEKKLYWTLMRENYTCIFPEIMEVLKGHPECKSITVNCDSIILEKQSGIKMLFNFKESFCRAEIDLCNAIDPEKEDIRIVKELLAKRDTNVVFDIGANVGMFSLELYHNSPDAEYYMFEPIPTTFSTLKKTINLNDVNGDRFHPVNMGLSNGKGSFMFYLPGHSEAASLRPIDDEFYRKNSDEYGNYTGSNEMVEVECSVTTVDDYIAENGIETVDFMKIDVEGNEKYVLEGARNTLKRHRPLVYCELLRKHAKRFGYHPNDVIRFMNDLGYECFVIRNGDRFIVERIDEDTVETNFLFERLTYDE